jgi:hypothetical protein
MRRKNPLAGQLAQSCHPGLLVNLCFLHSIPNSTPCIITSSTVGAFALELFVGATPHTLRHPPTGVSKVRR